MRARGVLRSDALVGQDAEERLVRRDWRKSFSSTVRREIWDSRAGGIISWFETIQDRTQGSEHCGKTKWNVSIRLNKASSEHACRLPPSIFHRFHENHSFAGDWIEKPEPEEDRTAFEEAGCRPTGPGMLKDCQNLCDNVTP